MKTNWSDFIIVLVMIICLALMVYGLYRIYYQIDSRDQTQVIEFLSVSIIVIIDIILFFLCALQFVCTVPTIEDFCQDLQSPELASLSA